MEDTPRIQHLESIIKDQQGIINQQRCRIAEVESHLVTAVDLKSRWFRFLPAFRFPFASRRPALPHESVAYAMHSKDVTRTDRVLFEFLAQFHDQVVHAPGVN